MASRNAPAGSSKQTAREGARKDAAQKVAKSSRAVKKKTGSTSSTSRGKGRKRVLSEDEGSDAEVAPAPKKKRGARGNNAAEAAGLEEQGFVEVGTDNAEGEGGDEYDDDEDIPNELLSDAALLGTFGCRRCYRAS